MVFETFLPNFDDIADEFEPEVEEVEIPKPDIVLVKVGEVQWPAKVLEKTNAGTSIKIQLFDTDKSQMWKQAELITPFEHNKDLATSQELKTAFRKAKRCKAAQELIDWDS